MSNYLCECSIVNIVNTKQGKPLTKVALGELYYINYSINLVNERYVFVLMYSKLKRKESYENKRIVKLTVVFLL